MRTFLLADPSAEPVFFLLPSGRFNYQMLLDYLHDDKELSEAFPRATKGKRGQEPPPQNIYDVSNAIKILGYKPTSAKSTA